ncbi:MAG: dinitrogenase iron-molybdenum cofactor biosynthesis protein [Anaerolineae bacterium]|nr:dinitrogenase iron-molybdenum cofactor biosynthesis protein [Anaerolineae bacterium]
MKIAVVTDNGQTISAHFGRAPYYLVFTVEDGAIRRRELREKAGHHQAAGEHHDHDHSHEHPHEHGDCHEHSHEHGDCHEHSHEHDSGPHTADKHARMIEAIADCQVVIARGMGRGAYTAMQGANITPFVTDVVEPEAAVRAYLAGKLIDHAERLH